MHIYAGSTSFRRCQRFQSRLHIGQRLVNRPFADHALPEPIAQDLLLGRVILFQMLIPEKICVSPSSPLSGQQGASVTPQRRSVLPAFWSLAR